VIVIRAPQLENGQLSYSIDVLEGKVPDLAGPVTLFIDPFGWPLSPVSVCGAVSVGVSGAAEGVVWIRLCGSVWRVLAIRISPMRSIPPQAQLEEQQDWYGQVSPAGDDALSKAVGDL
jgi:hypothetical protein